MDLADEGRGVEERPRRPQGVAQVEAACPGLRGMRQPDGGLAAHYLLSLDGREFVTDLHQNVSPGGRVLILSADAGG